METFDENVEIDENIIMENSEIDNICLLCDSKMMEDDDLRVIHQKQIASFIKKSKSREEKDWMKWEGKHCQIIIFFYNFIASN